MSEQDQWFVAIQGQQHGPWKADEIEQKIRRAEIGPDAHVFKAGMDNWAPIADSPFGAAMATDRVASPVAAAAAPAAVASTAVAPTVAAAAPAFATASSGMRADEIEYEVFGEEMQFVEITLDPREACIAEAGSFMYMDPGIEMNTIFGDGSAKSDSGGFMDKLLSAGKRVLTGESLFMTVFGNGAQQRQKVAFASPYPGRIVPLNLPDHGGAVLCQKDAFLCAAKGVAVGIAFQKKLGAGLFGGEGFILQKLEGDGLAFVHAGGTIVRRELQPGERLRLDTGCLVAFDQTVSYDIQTVPGIKTALFGGEGLFFAALTGPGTIWIQSLPFSRLASRIYAAAPQTGGKRQGEGSVLGGIGGLVMGDR